MEKIWLVTQESNVDGEILFNVVPCVSEETAKKIMQEEKETILNESHHFGNSVDPYDDFEIEESGNTFFINDPCDDYYEEIKVFEAEIQY
jgi:hypothetical protein